MHRLLTRPSRATFFLAAVAALGCHASGASQSTAAPGAPANFAPWAPETFDLLVYGADFETGEHEVFLRTNLDYGAEWVSLGTLDPVMAGDAWTTTIFSGLDTRRFLGQDFRESYLDFKIVTRADADGSRISAIYAMPHVAPAAGAVDAITRLIESDPLAVERLSVASQVQPRPAPLRPGADYAEHVRAPMADPRPGVMEVLQLQVEWRNREQ